MKALVVATFCALTSLSGAVLSGVARAADAAAPTPATVAPADRPTEDSIKQLLQLMQLQKVVETMSKQMDAAFTATLNKQLEGKQLTDEDKKRIEEGRARMKAVVGKLLTWDTMQRIYLKTYGETFTQSEIDSMIGFYGSPAGQAVVAKLPLAIQNSMAAVQAEMRDIFPQVQQIAKDTVGSINGAHKSG